MSNLYELRKFVAPEVVFGEGALNLVGRYVANFMARKVLIVTDPGVRAAGWTRQVEASLRAAGIRYLIFDKVTPNPKDHEVSTGSAYYRANRCDVIVAVGGGSVIDCAKGIGILSSNGEGSILQYEGVDEIRLPGPPLVCVPTTAGSSADISQFAILLDPARRVKSALISKLLVPDVALIDPLTTTSMPPELTAATGMDVLVHAIEAYVSNASSPITDVNALEAMRLVIAHLPGAIEQPRSLEARAPMMNASMLAGLAFSNASLGLVHGMAHSLGGFLDLAHGDCNAILLEHVIYSNYPASPERYRRIAEVMGIQTRGLSYEGVRDALIEAVAELRCKVGLDHKLSTLGVKKTDIPQLARNALVDPCLATNPFQPTLKEIEEIYERAL